MLQKSAVEIRQINDNGILHSVKVYVSCPVLITWHRLNLGIYCKLHNVSEELPLASGKVERVRLKIY